MLGQRRLRAGDVRVDPILNIVVCFHVEGFICG